MPCAGSFCARFGFNFRSWPPVFSPSVLLFSAFRTPFSCLPRPSCPRPFRHRSHSALPVLRSPRRGQALCAMQKRCLENVNSPLISRYLFPDFIKEEHFSRRKSENCLQRVPFPIFLPRHFILCFLSYISICQRFTQKNGCVRFRRSQKNQPPLHFIADTPKIASESLSRTAD